MSKREKVRRSSKSKNIVSTSRPLELLYSNLFGPTIITSMSGKSYGLVVVDDYSRWASVMFLAYKDDSFIVFSIFCKRVQNEKSINISSIKSDHEVEFENENFQRLCEKHDILKRIFMNYGRINNPTYHTFILLDDNLGKFDPKSDKEIFLGFSNASKAYKTDKELSKLYDSIADLNLEYLQMSSKETYLDEDSKDNKSEPSSRNWLIFNGNVQDKVRTRSTFKDQAQGALLFEVEPKSIHKLVTLPKDKSIIRKKWIFKNKLDENGKVLRNKVRLVAQGYSQHEGIDFTKTFTLIARLEAIFILLSFVAHNHMRLHQMDVKCAFFNGIKNEEVYVKQPPGFESDTFPYHVFKVKKALHGLKQAPRAWYGKLSSFLMKNEFERGKVDITFFLQKLQLTFYHCRIQNEYDRKVEVLFRTSNQTSRGWNLHPSNIELIKKFNLEDCKSMSTPMHPIYILTYMIQIKRYLKTNLGLWFKKSN
ncbi:hypothetical protein CR513_21817, partial [Mucuna pruriens]